MQTAYAQKNETTQRAADNTAAAVHDNSPQSVSLQRHASLANAAVQRAENPPRPNNTGLPDDLKNGVESLSGYSLDNVRVHYNSPKPATVQALAYTQGTDIHVAPGQEHALPHEAWHVTQQMAGRVTPTTNIGGMPVNDNAALEHEADVMGEKAVTQRFPLDFERNAFIERDNRVSATPAQRKVKLNGTVYEKVDDLLKSIGEGSLENQMGSAFKEVHDKMPYSIQEEIKNKNVECNQNLFNGMLTAWVEYKDVTYEYKSENLEKLAKDAVKYWFSKNYRWQSVGVGEYMTGDVTGLGIAASISPEMTLKILPLSESERNDGIPSMKPKKGDRISKENLPSILSTLATEEKNQIKFGNKKGENARTVYKIRYNAKHKRSVKKPWNKETYVATEEIGKKYGARKDDIKEMLLPKDENVKKNIASYKDKLFEAKKIEKKAPCILIWQRLSGQNKGAHPELDSSKYVLKQIAEIIFANFPNYTIILIGDKTEAKNIFEAELKEKVVEFNEYWKYSDDLWAECGGENLFVKDRKNQNYFLKLISEENSAVSIGMRSGSLESSALLGIKTIYIDDLNNVAQDRMELWAGKAANERKDNLFNEKFESEKQGPVPNYKRIGTSRKLGSNADMSYEKFKNLFEPSIIENKDDLENEIETINEKCLDDSKSFANSKKKCRTELYQKKKKIEDLNKKIEDLNKEKEDLNKKIEDLNKEIEGLNKEIEGLNKKIEDLNKCESFVNGLNLNDLESSLNKIEPEIVKTEIENRIKLINSIKPKEDINSIIGINDVIDRKDFLQALSQDDFNKLKQDKLKLENWFLTENELIQIVSLVKYLNEQEQNSINLSQVQGESQLPIGFEVEVDCSEGNNCLLYSMGIPENEFENIRCLTMEYEETNGGYVEASKDGYLNPETVFPVLWEKGLLQRNVWIYDGMHCRWIYWSHESGVQYNKDFVYNQSEKWLWYNGFNHYKRLQKSTSHASEGKKK